MGGEFSDGLRSDHQVEAMLVVGFCERGDSRISENGPSGQIVGEGAVDLLRGELCELFVFGSDADEDEVREGWVVPLFAELDLLVAESVEIVVACELDAWMVRSEGLHEHFALDLTAACAACNLGQKLEGSLPCAEVWHLKADVCIDDTDQRDPWKIEPFGDHLCAHEDVDLPCSERSEGFAEGAFALHDVCIHAANDGFREDLHDGVLDFFRS